MVWLNCKASLERHCFPSVAEKVDIDLRSKTCIWEMRLTWLNNISLCPGSKISSATLLPLTWPLQFGKCVRPQQCLEVHCSIVTLWFLSQNTLHFQKPRWGYLDFMKINGLLFRFFLNLNSLKRSFSGLEMMFSHDKLPTSSQEN